MHIRRVKIKNVRGFSEVDLDFSRPDGSLAGWTVLAGRNGSGKSTLLKAIALAVAGPDAARVLKPSFADWVRVGQTNAEVKAQLTFSGSDQFEHIDLEAGWARLRWELSEIAGEPNLSGALPGTQDSSLLLGKQPNLDVVFVNDPEDREEVESVARALEELGIRPWFAQWNLRPGRNTLATLAEIGEEAPVMAVFLGHRGPDYYTPHRNRQLVEIIKKFAAKSRPVIPVFLASAGSYKYLPSALEGLGSVDFRSDEKPLERLAWGITGASGRAQFAAEILRARSRVGWFLCAYGPYRRLSGHAVDAQRLMAGPAAISRLVSLFREDSSLLECVEWLREIYLQRLERRPGAAEIEQLVLAFLNDGLLPDDVRVEGIDSQGLWVVQRGVRLPLSELSDGYRTTAALVMDIVRHLLQSTEGSHLKSSAKQVRQSPKIGREGVVLIDEVDLHLHVDWQKRFGFWLKKHFPNIQFIVTTHSPFICQAADPSGLIRLPASGEERPAGQVSAELYNTVVNGGADDAVLTELFGLETPYSEPAERLREQVAQLEAKLQTGKATEKDRHELHQLRSRLPQNLNSDVEQALRKLASNG